MALRGRHRRARRSEVAEGAPGRGALPCYTRCTLRWVEYLASAGKEAEKNPQCRCEFTDRYISVEKVRKGGGCVKKPGEEKKEKKKSEEMQRSHRSEPPASPRCARRRFLSPLLLTALRGTALQRPCWSDG